MKLASSALAEEAFERCQRRLNPFQKQCIYGSQTVGLYGIAKMNYKIKFSDHGITIVLKLSPHSIRSIF